MGDKSLGPHDFVVLASHPAVPGTGAVRMYSVGDKIWLVDSAGNRYDLTIGRKVVYKEATTNSAGQWSVTYGGEFTQVDFVEPVAIHETGDIGEQKWASLHRYDNTSANGRVVEFNAIVSVLVGGGQGGEYSEAGVRVRVRIEGKGAI
jgi:hypothetical protein